MNYDTLISAEELAALYEEGAPLVIDCRHELADPGKGERAYAEGHLPGAIYAHLDRDLSDLSRTELGRHPLPSADAFAAVLARWGFAQQRQVVVYDDAGGAIAARLWWMLRLIGHHDVAVLDGGIAAWSAADLPLTREVPPLAACEPELAFDASQIVYVPELQQLQAQHAALLLDARAAPRFRGEVEPIDPVAGHIPGARNRAFSQNLDGGRFKHADDLREEFSELLGDIEPQNVVHMCGSGVTACHNLLALAHAGLGAGLLYADSWSGWISDPKRPVATGA